MEGPALDRFDELLKEVLTDFQPDPLRHRQPPLTREDIQAAIDRIANERYQRDRYVIPRPKWEKILEAGGDQFRRDMDSLVENGTVILSDHLPHSDIMYRFRPPPPPPPGTRYYPDSWNAQ